MKLKAIIVDDELNAIKMLKMLLDENCSDVEVIKTFQDPGEAINYIKSTSFDILFLDVQMPEMTGFQMLKKFDCIDFEIVFTTSHDEFAIEAFRINAANYLLKPVDEEELVNAIENIKKIKDKEHNYLLKLLSNFNPQNEFNNSKISIPFATGKEFLNTNEIIYCKSDNNYTDIYLTDSTTRLVSKGLKYFEKELPSQMFYRPHNSYLINLNFVSKYHRNDGGYIEMINGDIIRISRNKKDDILNLL